MQTLCIENKNILKMVICVSEYLSYDLYRSYPYIIKISSD